MNGVVATGWTPEQWILVVGSVVSSITAAAVAVIGAIRTNKVHSELKPPSNNVSLGALVEAIAQIQHLQTGMSHPNEDIPAAMSVGRRLQDAADAGEVPSDQVGGNGADRRVMRRPEHSDRRTEERPEDQ